MATSQRRSALVASVAQALSFAIDDPVGHSSWALSQHRESPCKRLRGAAETHHSATVFDSSAIPPIGIDKYLMRLSANFKCSDASFIAALIVVDRLLEYDGGRLPLTMRNVHRIFFASLVVAVKYHEDLVYSNSHYAKAGGVHLREVNRLERVLLRALDFDLRILPEQYQTYEAALLALCDHAPQKHSTNLEGSPCKPLGLEGVIAAPTSSAVDEPFAGTQASATEAAPLPERQVWPAVATPAAALCRKAATATYPARPVRFTKIGMGGIGGGTLWPTVGGEKEFCVPWVVPAGRADLEILAVPGSRCTSICR